MTKEQKFMADCMHFGLVLSFDKESEKLLAAYKRGEQWAVAEVLRIRALPSSMLFD